MPGKSSISAGATYLDKEQRLAELRAMARRASERLPSIRRILLFGSLHNGIPTPRSDADLLVEVSQSPYEHPQDRTPEVLRALSPLVCPVDVFVYTSAEIDEHAGSPVVRQALQGTDLLA